MPVLNRCPLGHSWEPAGGERYCPVCGWVVPHDASTLEARTEAYQPGAELSTVDFRAPQSDPGAPALPAVPGYVVLGVLGKGGMGVVYKARQVRLDRLVALKMIRSGLHAGAEEVERFRAEARAVARLNHPHIVQIYEVGEHDGQAYLALEYLDGGGLNQRLRGQPQPPREAAALVRSLAEAVQAAHDAGVVHRDLKPANVLLAADVPKVSDFGLAKQLDTDAAQTRTGAVVGTPSYMAPEQAEGRTHEIGPAADVYGLGAILYEMITGRPPFRGATLWETLEQVRCHEPVPPRQLQPGCPRDLETVCLKCLEKPPSRRYATARELADDLERFLNGEPIRARPVGMAERLWKLARRRPLITLLAATFAAVLVGGFALILQAWGQAEADRIAAVEQGKQATEQAVAEEAARGEAIQAKEEALAAEKTARLAQDRAEHGLYRNQMNLAGLEWNADHFAKTIELLRQCPEPLRHWEWRYLLRQTATSAYTIRGNVSAAFNPDGSRLAYFLPDGKIEIQELATHRVITTLPGHPGGGIRLAYLPDGRTLVSVGKDDAIRSWDPGAGTESLNLSVKEPIWGMAVHPKGQQMALLLSGGTVSVWDLGEGREAYRRQGAAQGLDTRAIAYSTDGKYLAAPVSLRSVKVWTAEDGKEALTIPSQTTIYSLAFHPDGKHLVMGRLSRTDVYDLGQKKYLFSYGSQRGQITALAFRADGARLAAGNAEGLVRSWDFPSGERTEVLRGHAQLIFTLAYSPDGKRLVTTGTDERVRVWDLGAPQEALTWMVPVGCNAVEFTRDGSQVATAGNDGVVRFWDARTGAPGRAFQAHGFWALGLAFSPDGKYLATGGSSRVDQPSGEFKVWDVKGGGMIFSGAGHQDDVRAVAFSPDGRLVASAGRSQHTKVWETATGALRLDLPGAGRAVAFSPDGKHIATISRAAEVAEVTIVSSLVVCRVDDGQEVLRVRVGANTVLCLTYSPDGTRILVGGGDWNKHGEVRVLDSQTGKELLLLRGHANVVFAMAISPDGQRLLTAGADGYPKVWDLRPNVSHGSRELLSLVGHRRALTWGAFSPDGNRLVTCEGFGTVKVWDGTPLSESEVKERLP